MYDMIDPLPGALKLKMPGFSVAWTIVDLVMVSLRTLELPFIIAFLVFSGAGGNRALQYVLFAELICVLLISFAGLTGNIAMLCRRHWALRFCIASSLFTLFSYIVMIWQLMMLYHGRSLVLLCSMIIGAVMFIMFRSALLVFNIISIVKAARFFKERDGYI